MSFELLASTYGECDKSHTMAARGSGKIRCEVGDDDPRGWFKGLACRIAWRSAEGFSGFLMVSGVQMISQSYHGSLLLDLDKQLAWRRVRIGS